MDWRNLGHRPSGKPDIGEIGLNRCTFAGKGGTGGSADKREDNADEDRD